MSDDDNLGNLFPKAQTLPEEMSPDDWYTTAEVSAKFGVQPKTVARWRRKGKFDGVKIIRTPGGHTRFSVSDINKLLDEHEDKAK